MDNFEHLGQDNQEDILWDELAALLNAAPESKKAERLPAASLLFCFL
ncbi:MAG: hypothetical protein GY796_19075 [Chloroflexi bacterium]|nr:hypothetical protein [Chloroflexota bacterium]